MMRFFLFALTTVFLSCGGQPETLIKGGYDEQEMVEAIARAQSEVDEFIATLSAKDGTNFAVKVPIEDKGETEHFWLTGVSFHDGKFEGLIGNDPGVVTNVK